MNTRFLPALLGLLLASFAPAAELILESETLTPTSTVEVRFDEPMVGKDKVGNVEKLPPIVLKPAVSGDFKWTSSRSGQFHFTEAPALGTAYTFSLRPGLRTADGKDLAAAELGTFKTEAFRIENEDKEYPYSYGESAQRVPTFLFQFTDVVDPTSAAQQFFFVSRFGKDRIPATARLANGNYFKRNYGTEIVPTWAEKFARSKPERPKGEATRPNALIVQSAEPLPPGVDWTLVMPAAFGNANGTATLGEQARRSWGSVQVLAVKRVETTTHFDGPHQIDIVFNKTVALTEWSKEQLASRNQTAASLVKVEPALANMEVQLNWFSLVIKGNFALNTPYTVTLEKGLLGADDLPLEQGASETVTFKPSPVFVSTSASQSGLLASGHGVFDIYAANHKELRVRVKQLTDGELLKARALQAQEYEGFDYDEKNKQPARERLTSFAQLPGKLVFEKVYPNGKPLEQGELLTLNWKEVLGQTPAAPVLVEIEAPSQVGAPQGVILNRSVVEFTDIGLLVKNTGEEALIYAFSLATG
ncbi:MAG: hypothetical protein ACOYMN_02105, partial [Roseimicrobium sp.]